VRAPHSVPLLVVLALLGACERDEVPARLQVLDGDTEFGRALIALR
jgi:hypothetical protein